MYGWFMLLYVDIGGYWRVCDMCKRIFIHVYDTCYELDIGVKIQYEATEVFPWKCLVNDYFRGNT